jgi:hypothetical protein
MLSLPQRAGLAKTGEPPPPYPPQQAAGKEGGTRTFRSANFRFEEAVILMAAGNNRAAPYAAFNLHGEPVAGSAGDHELGNRAELRLQLKVGPRNLHEKNYGTIYMSSIWPNHVIDK